MFPSWLLLLAICAFQSSGVQGLSCVSGAFSVSRSKAIRSSFCDNEDVYSGTVMAVTCNCMPGSNTGISTECRQFQLNSSSVISSRVLAAGVCSNSVSSIVLSCTTVVDSVSSTGLRVEGAGGVGGLTVQNLTRSNGGCNLTCDFNFNSSDEFTREHPCIYSVRVNEVFRGNYSSGDVVEVTGPSVLIGGVANRVLQVNTDYLVGVGGLCNPINEWSEASSFSSDDIQMLRGSIACSQISLSESSIVTITLSLVALVLLLQPFLFVPQ